MNAYSNQRQQSWLFLPVHRIEFPAHRLEIDARLIVRAQVCDHLAEQRFLTFDAQSAFESTAALGRAAPHHLGIDVDVFPIDTKAKCSDRSGRDLPIRSNPRAANRKIEHANRRVHSVAAGELRRDFVAFGIALLQCASPARQPEGPRSFWWPPAARSRT